MKPTRKAAEVKARVDVVEKIAREICWLDFATPGSDVTKAAYWKSISEEARQNYRCDARRFIWLYYAIPVDLLNAIESPLAPRRASRGRR